MTSKKVGSSIASLFQQWSSCCQDNKGGSSSSSSSDDGDGKSNKSYRIVFQTNYSMRIRCQAAESVENVQVYRRAGIPTPKESAVRDIAGSKAWLEHLAGLAEKAHCHVVWIRTRRTSSSSFSQSRPEKTTTTTIDLSEDPWGWDSEGNDQPVDSSSFSSSSPPSLADLSKLADYIRQQTLEQEKSTAAVVLIWDSLEPLFVVHGFVKTVRFLVKFQNCLQIWPIRIDTLSGSQHAILEDAAQALLQLQAGDMTMIRQGIREPGNIVRERLPFRLDEGSNTTIKVIEENTSIDHAETTQNAAATDATASRARTGLVNSATTSSSSSRPKIQLKMEEEDEKRAPEPAANRPRIFLQDDDPEFDDLDEEDPDEDLDI